jgi:AcrR family transcriptional regulator
VSSQETSTAKRRYVMRERADSTAATRERIVHAAITTAMERRTLEVTLQEVSERADVTVQTVLRHYGSREGLLDAATAVASAQVDAERRVTPGDVREAVRAVVGHYERVGDFVVALLAESQRSERARAITEPGKALHREWVRASFAPYLTLRDHVAAETLTDLLVVVTDLYTWVLLRRDRGLSRAQTEQRMSMLLEAVLAGPGGAAADQGGNEQ